MKKARTIFEIGLYGGFFLFLLLNLIVIAVGFVSMLFGWDSIVFPIKAIRDIQSWFDWLPYCFAFIFLGSAVGLSIVLVIDRDSREYPEDWPIWRRALGCTGCWIALLFPFWIVPLVVWVTSKVLGK
jgi:hypothetical protein